MRHRSLLLAALTASLVVGAAGPAIATASTVSSINSGPFRHDLPADAPRALYEQQRSLPNARGWPASNNAFPATSGTGRYADGAYYWTDFLYDDHGGTTASPGNVAVTAGSPSFGTYTYPPGPAHHNGADIFRAGVALRKHYTAWRVDWNTLASKNVPIAEWGLDTDDKTTTGVSRWPGKAGVSSPGIDAFLIMSAKRAEVISATTGKVEYHRRVSVTRGVNSFVVRIPDRVLKPTGKWRIRLVSGLADAAGTGFAEPPRVTAAQTNVYNVGFRKRSQEPQGDDFWDDMAQTKALDKSNVSKFSAVLHWRKLAHHVRTRQAEPTGWSDRWYVSSVSLGPGIITSPASIEDGKANYLGRVQPYAIYVPKGYTGRKPTPLTFLLHSLTQNQNQYAATTPKFTQQACQDRHSICVTTLGRGPDGDYFGSAELDFWQVWHSVASAYNLNPNRTVLCGYSMGGFGTNQLATAHPDLFARAITMAGAVGDVPALVNLQWIPTYLAGGAEDELVPVTTERAEADGLKALGYRFQWLLIPAIDHVAYELADSFAAAAKYMGNAKRVINPGQFTFRWTPHNVNQLGGGLSWTQDPKIGVGTTGDYWLRHFKARNNHIDAQVKADSGERPVPAVTTHASRRVDASAKPEPGVVTAQTWTRGPRSTRRPVIHLKLTNVRSLTLLRRAAGFRSHTTGRLVVSTDGPVQIRVGHRARHVAKGRHTLHFRG